MKFDFSNAVAKKPLIIPSKEDILKEIDGLVSHENMFAFLVLTEENPKRAKIGVGFAWEEVKKHYAIPKEMKYPKNNIFDYLNVLVVPKEKAKKPYNLPPKEEILKKMASLVNDNDLFALSVMIKHDKEKFNEGLKMAWEQVWEIYEKP